MMSQKTTMKKNSLKKKVSNDDIIEVTPMQKESSVKIDLEMKVSSGRHAASPIEIEDEE